MGLVYYVRIDEKVVVSRIVSVKIGFRRVDSHLTQKAGIGELSRATPASERLLLPRKAFQQLHADRLWRTKSMLVLCVAG